MPDDRGGRISVVIPSFNVELWLSDAIESVLAQSVQPHEIIVVDDGSTDSTADVARGFGGAITLVQQANRGLSAARNAGAAIATGDAVLFLDADDLVLEDGLRYLNDELWADPTLGVVVPTFEIEHSDGTVARPPGSTRRFGRHDLAEVLRANPLGANSLIRKDVWTRYRYDESFRACEDLDLWTRLLLDDIAVLRLYPPALRRRIGRKGALTGELVRMRRCRRQVFERVWATGRLGPRERAVTTYQLARSSIGEATAASEGGSEASAEALRVMRRSPHALPRAVARLLGLVPGLMSILRRWDRRELP